MSSVNDKLAMSLSEVQAKTKCSMNIHQKTKECSEVLEDPCTSTRQSLLQESTEIEQSKIYSRLNQFKLLDLIGQGSYGLVKLAYSEEDSTHYAMKILSKRKLIRQAGLIRKGPKKHTNPLDRVYREIAVLKKLDHPNVVKLIEVLDDPLKDSLYMVFELVNQGEIINIPTNNPLTEECARSIFRDTLLGLEYLHFQKVIHGDLKPSNLLLNEYNRVKIADFGVCNEFQGNDATISNSITAGTPAFRAPETISQGRVYYCGKAADIWALGVTLYALVYGNVPFVAHTVPILYQKIRAEEINFADTPKIGENLVDCIQRMLNKNPVLRITLSELKAHPWVTCQNQILLPTEAENCRLIKINSYEIKSVVRVVPKLDTLILIKTMLKKHSFGNPFTKLNDQEGPAQQDTHNKEIIARSKRSNSAPSSCYYIR